MSPAKLYHGAFQSEIGHILKSIRKQQGKVVAGCAIGTERGTKVADVAWFSQERWEAVKDEFESPVAPEICVEIVSESNTEKEFSEKMGLYFEKGAREFWLCEKDGTMRFWDRRQGRVPKSLLMPEFPDKVDI